MSRISSGPGAPDDNEGELTGRLRGRIQTMLTYADATADPRPLVGLLREVTAAVGPASPLALLVEYRVEELRSRARSVADSAAVWDALHARAEAALEPRDTTLMSIKALHARYTRLSSGPADRDEAVATYEVEWRRRLAILGAQAHRTSTAHANLAVALRDRGRQDDLRRACRIARAELALRRTVWGADHAFTWIARVILAQTLLRIVERFAPGPDGAGPAAGPATASAHLDALAAADAASVAAEDDAAAGGTGPDEPDDDPARDGRPDGLLDGYPPVPEDDLARPHADLAAEARALAAQVVASRRERFGPAAPQTLRAELVHAHALLLTGEPAVAVAEIRYVLAVDRRTGPALDPGWPELLLARAMVAAGLDDAGGGLDDALRQARAAVEARLSRYP
ncbi:hypothetical protein I6A81_14540, partial [Frankia sp. CN7]